MGFLDLNCAGWAREGRADGWWGESDSQVKGLRYCKISIVNAFVTEHLR